MTHDAHNLPSRKGFEDHDMTRFIDPRGVLLKLLGRIAALTLLATMPAAVAAETRTFDLTGFSEIAVSDGVRIVVDVGENYAIEAESDRRRLLDRLRLEVSGQRLSIGLDRAGLSLLNRATAHVTVSVSLPDLSRIEAAAGSEVAIDAMVGDGLTVIASSGAELDITSLTGGAITAQVDSGARVSANGGTCDQLLAEVGSGGSLSFGSVTCAGVEVSAGSGGQASVHASQAVMATASSGGGVRVLGEATDREITTSGGGQITLRE